MGGFDPDAYLAKKDTTTFDPDKYLSEEETIVEEEQTDEIKPSGKEVVTEKTEELALPSPVKYEPRLRLSGKDISLMQKATDAAFSSSDIFTGVNGQRNKDIYYTALLKQGYTPDDISLIKGEKEGFMYGKPDKQVWSGGKTAETNKPQTIQPTQELYDPDLAVQSFGGSRNYNVYKGTSELFKNDPFFADNSDNRDAFYNRLKEKGVDEKSLNLIRNNVENELTDKKFSEGQGFAALVNPMGAVGVMAKDMIKSGHDLVTDKQEFDKLKNVIAEEGLAAGTAVAVKAALDVAMGALAVTPAGMAFTVGYNVAHDIAPGAIEFLGSWPSTIAKNVFGYEPKSEGAKALWGIIDFMGFAVGLGGIHKGGKWTKEKAAEVLDPTLKDNRDAQIRDLTRRYGNLTRKQKENAAQEWYNMMAQNRLVPLTEQRIQTKDAGKLATDLYDEAKNIDEQKRTEYEQAKAQIEKTSEPKPEPKTEPKSDTPEKVQAAISEFLPKLKEYIVGFDVTTPLNEVATGLSVKYQGRNGRLGRDDVTGEIIFSDYSNGKTEIISGGGDTTPFADKGLSVNEGYYENYYVQGDANGYTVYKIGAGGMKPAFEGKKANAQRRDAIIRKALGKSPLTIEAEKAADKVTQLNAALQKAQGTSAEPLLIQAVEKAKKEATVKNEEAIVEQHADAMGEVVKVELQEKIDQLEMTAEGLNDAGKEALAPAIAEAKAMLEDLNKKDKIEEEIPTNEKVNQEGRQEGLLTEPTAEPRPSDKELSPIEQAKEKLAQAKAKAASLRDAGKLGTATDPFKQVAEQAKADREMHEAYINLAVEYIKEYAKKGLDTIEEFSKYIGEPITDALKTAWNDAVNATNPKGVIGHAYNARNFSEQVKLKIVQLGLNYEPRSQKEAASKADEFIKTIGVEDAVNQANNRANDLNGDVRTMIIARAIEYWHDIEVNAKTESAKTKAQEAQGELLDNLDMTSRDLGQQISALNHFYKTSPLGFQSFITKREQRISTEGLTEKPKRGKSKLDKIRENKENLTTGAQQEAAKEVGKQAAKAKPSSISEKTKVLANNVRKLKTKPFKFVDENGVEYDVHTMGVTWNDLVEGVARTIEEAGELSDKASIKIKELAKDFPLYNKLSESDKSRFTEQLISAASKEIKDSAKRVKEITAKLEKAIATGNKAASDKAIAELQQVSKEEGLWGQYRDLAARRIKNMTVSSLLGDAKQKPILQEFVDGLVKNMLQKINESLPQQKKTGKPKSSLEILSDAIKNQEKYKDVWEKAKAELEERFKDDPSKLDELDRYFGELFDKPFSDKMLESSVKEGIKAEGIDIGKLAEEHFMAADATKEKLVDKLIKQAQLSPEDARKLATDLQQKFDKIVSDKRMDVLNRMFPQNRAKSLAAKVGLKLRERENANIVKAINAGALDDHKFERLFYNKFGILDVNTPEIQAKLKKFSKRLYDAQNANNSLFYDRAMQDMVDYIEGKRRQSLLKKVGSGLGSQMYANMLYGYETHIRNTSFNILKSSGSIASAMASNPRYTAQFLTAFAKELYRGKVEATAIMKEGYKKSGDPITDARGLSERVDNLWGKYTAIPFRMLSAMDAALNFPSRSMKTYQYLLEDAIKKNNELPEGQRKTKSEIIDEVNEQMGYDTISDMAAEAEALQQIKKEYGMDDLWENGERKYKNKEYDRIYRDFERSVFNIKEAKRPEIAVEDAKDWADNALLIGKPKGWFGVAAHFLNKWGKAAPIAKILTTPFVNVPLNVAAHMAEFSPLGFGTIIVGKEAWGLSRESAKHFGIEQLMTERRQKQLMAKAVSGTVGMVAANALTQINYYDRDEKRVRPVMIIFADGLGSYNDNRKLENLVGSEKFKEYTVDFMGQRFSYKYSPFASWFLPSGAIHDYEKYHGGEDQKIGEKITNESFYTAWKYIAFVKDQAAVQGIADLFGFSASIPKNSTDDAIGQMIKDKTKDQVARIIRTLTVPNFIPQAMRDYKGLTDGIESGGYRFIDRLAKDVPFADQFVGKNEDHFGDPIKAQFEIPSIVSDEKPDNKYYQMVKDHDALDRLRFYSDRTLWINGENRILTNGQIDQVNKLRNRIAGKEIKERYEELNQLDNEDFRDELNRIYREAEADAKNKLFGVSGWSNTDPSKKKKFSSGESPEMEAEPEMEGELENN